MLFDHMPRIDARTLVSDPKYMREWLKSKSPSDIVTKNIVDDRRCLGATFLRENGYPNATWITDWGYPIGGHEILRAEGCVLSRTIFDLVNRRIFRDITADQVLRSLERVTV